MGATNDIKETNVGLQLAGKDCSQCDQPFTEEEIDAGNYDIYFDTSNEVSLTPLAKGYQLTIWIRSIEHENCPDTRTCQRCYERFLTEKMKRFKPNEPFSGIARYFLDEYYCSPCWKERNKEKNHG